MEKLIYGNGGLYFLDNDGDLKFAPLRYGIDLTIQGQKAGAVNLMQESYYIDFNSISENEAKECRAIQSILKTM